MARKRSARKKKSSRRTAKFDPVPPGFGTVTPYLTIDGAAQALDFYKRAFGAKELARQTAPDGKILHARMRIGNSNVMLSDIFPGSPHKSPLELGASSVIMHVYTGNVDGLWQRAISAGAKETMPIDNQFWGERYGQLVDPFGHHWSLSQRIRMSKKEKDEKQKAAMAMFAGGEHPGASSQQG